MKLLVGLGNPGTRYERTRHNVGFMVLDLLAGELGMSFNKKQAQSLVAQGMWGNEKVLLAKPQTYMNKSGEAVLELLNFYQDGISDLIVIHDDLDLDFSRLRFKQNGGSGGHNGLRSISHLLNSPDYSRLKIGIGRNPSFMKVENYVLSEFLPEEKKLLPEVLKTAVEGLGVWNREGIVRAMNGYNAAELQVNKAEEEK